MRKQVLSVLLAVMLVSSAFGPVGVASASHECDQDVGWMIALEDYHHAFTDETCQMWHDSSTEVDPAEYEEAQQVQSEIYSQALGQASGADNVNTTYSNYLQDTSSVSKMEGKNAFIRSLENGSTKSQAIADARQATLDYYSARQKQLLKSWDSKALSYKRMVSSVNSEANLTNEQVLSINYTDAGVPKSRIVASAELTNVSISLLNGSTETAYRIDGSNTNTETWDLSINSYNLPADLPFTHLGVLPPDSQTDAGATPVKMIDRSKWEPLWTEIENQGLAQADEVETFANQTYDQWSAGVISTEDLVDPYLGAREYDPNATQTWAMRSLTAIGVSPPSNVSNLDSMQIEDYHDGVTVNGVLMTQADPANASGYEIGATYDVANIDGHVFVATNNGSHRLDGEFRIKSVNGLDGNYSSGDVVGYDRPEYQTTDLSEYKNLSNQIIEIRKALEEREQNIEEDAVVVAPSDGGSDPLLLIIAMLGVLAAGAGYMYQQKSEELDRMVKYR